MNFSIKLMYVSALFAVLLGASACFYVSQKIDNYLPLITQTNEKRLNLGNEIEKNEFVLTKDHFYELIEAEQIWGKANSGILNETKSLLFVVGVLLVWVAYSLLYLGYKLKNGSDETP